MNSAPAEEERLGLLGLDEEPPSSVRTAEAGIMRLDYRNVVSLAKNRWHSSWKASFGRFAWFLLPSFVQSHMSPNKSQPAKLHPTAYFDGMRGFASFAVFLYHFTFQCYQADVGWGAEGENHDLMRLPFIRLLYGGSSSVALFFVISGFALSYKPIRLIRSRNTHDLCDTMSSLVFRRAARLFLPIIASTIMIVTLTRLHFYGWTRDFAGDDKYFRVYHENHPVRLISAWDQWVDWVWIMIDQIGCFHWNGGNPAHRFDPHLWTIPTEYRCSLYLFLVLVGTARLKPLWRWTTVLGVAGVSFHKCRWDFMLFLAGMAIAESIRARDDGAKDPYRNPEKYHLRPNAQRVRAFCWHVMAVVGLYLMSYPQKHASTTPGYIGLSEMNPEWWVGKPSRIWQSTGSVIFALAVTYTPAWQKFFELDLNQYLGKISFALYLVHGPTTHIIGFQWLRFTWGMTGIEGNGYHMGFFLGVLMTVPFAIWAADIFWRAVDMPSVKFAKWLETQLNVKDD